VRRCRFLRGLRYPLMQGSQLYPLMQGSQLGVSTKSAPESETVNGQGEADQGEAGQDGVGGLPLGDGRLQDGVARLPLVCELPHRVRMVAEAQEQHRSLHTQAGANVEGAGCTDIHAYRQRAHVPGRMSQPPGTMRTMRQLAAMGSPAWLSEGGSAAALSRSRVVFAFWKRALFWERFCYLLLPRPPWRIHRSASPITSQNSLPHPSASPWHFSRPVMT